MILHLCKDLMLVGKVSAWAKANDVAYKSASSLQKFEDALQSGDVQQVVVDLQFKMLDVGELAESVRQQPGELPLVGYAQHVMTDLIDSAKTAGFDKVLTRGQFDHGFADFLAGTN